MTTMLMIFLIGYYGLCRVFSLFELKTINFTMTTMISIFILKTNKTKQPNAKIVAQSQIK